MSPRSRAALAHPPRPPFHVLDVHPSAFVFAGRPPAPCVLRRRAAETIGCRVHGITLSKEQKALAEEKVQQKHDNWRVHTYNY